LRLDKFLFFARLTKTRALAQKILGESHIRVDGQPITSAHVKINVGQVITMPLHQHIRVIKVEALPIRRGPASEAQQCYTDLSPEIPGLTAARGDSNR
jgi:ribosome-associated heat shock protein Hsp15